MASRPVSAMKSSKRGVSDDEKRFTGEYDVSADCLIPPDPASYFLRSRTAVVKPNPEPPMKFSDKPQPQPSVTNPVEHGKGFDNDVPFKNAALMNRPVVLPRTSSHSSIKLEAFESVGRHESPAVYEKVAAKETYVLASKTHRNQSGILGNIMMLQMGTLGSESNRSTVWAHSNGEKIQYYGGREPSMMIVPFETALSTDIRYAEPFQYLSSSKLAVHALIHFLFLKFAITDKLFATNDIILQFKEACQVLKAHHWATIEGESSRIEGYDNTLAVHAEANDQGMLGNETRRTPTTSDMRNENPPNNGNHDRNFGSTEDHSYPRENMSARISYSRDHIVSGPAARYSGKSRVPSLVDQVKTFEDQLRAEVAEDRAGLEQENSALKKRLEEQKQWVDRAQAGLVDSMKKIYAEKMKVDAEREGREFAEQSLKEARDELKEKEKARSDWEQQSKVYEADVQHWQTKYTGLKRKLQGLAEDEDEPAKKVAKR